MSALQTLFFIFIFVLLRSDTQQQPTASWSKTNDVTADTYATSTAAMVPLLKMEDELMQNMYDYAKKLQQKLQLLRAGLSQMRAFRIKYDAELELSNPLKNYALMRHMSADWRKWFALLQKRFGVDQIKFIKRMQHKLPNAADLREAVTGILRIQNTYGLNAKDIANGLLYDKQYPTTLNTLDRFEIGLAEYDNKNFDIANKWLPLTLENWQPNHDKMYEILGLRLVNVIQLIVLAWERQNKKRTALELIGYFAEILPKYNLQLQLYKSHLVRSILDLNNTREVLEPPASSYMELNEEYCIQKYQSSSKSLVCRLNHTNTPFLILAPLRMEELQLEPYVVLFHNVLYESEIAELKAISTPNLQRAKVFNNKLDKSIIVTERATQMTRLWDTSLSIIGRINRRITDMTRFSLKNSAPLQAINYGIGGFYNWHFDFFDHFRKTTTQQNATDRIATVLFYLSDVDQGGATTIHNGRTPLVVNPKKGSALLWYNLNNAGVGQEKTFHAACPVIVGSKWVMTKWIDYNSQVFIKPCFKQN